MPGHSRECGPTHACSHVVNLLRRARSLSDKPRRRRRVRALRAHRSKSRPAPTVLPPNPRNLASTASRHIDKSAASSYYANATRRDASSSAVSFTAGAAWRARAIPTTCPSSRSRPPVAARCQSLAGAAGGLDREKAARGPGSRRPERRAARGRRAARRSRSQQATPRHARARQGRLFFSLLRRSGGGPDS
jgi:hypothetical protein